MTGKQTARTVGFKSGERNVFFHLLTACNLSCRHCYINPPQHGSRTLTKEKILDWLKIFARPNQPSNLILLGGEPTLHPDLPEIIRAAKKMRFAVTIDSNGYLFHDFLNKVKPHELDFLSFSLDGPDAEVNDPIRGKGVFETCTKNLREAVKNGFRVSLIYTVSNFNIQHLHRMPELLQHLGVKRFFIQVIGMRGKPASDKKNEETAWQVDPQQWLEIVPKTARRASELGIHVTFPKVFLDEDEEFQCAGQVADNYFIFPNGKVYQCPLCEDYPIHTYIIENNKLVRHEGLNEDSFFPLSIPEGCVMNKLLQPDNIEYATNGVPKHRISCCLLKQEIVPEQKKNQQ